MAIKGYSAFPKAPTLLEPHHQIVRSHIQDTWAMDKLMPSRLILICQDIFQTYGTPEELSSNGGPPFTSLPFKQFSQDWAVKHRLSSVAYPQSNGQAELTDKSTKRIITGNTAQGSFDNDHATRAILQYKNTSIQNIGLSPAQLLLHCRLLDFVPSQPTL